MHRDSSLSDYLTLLQLFKTDNHQIKRATRYDLRKFNTHKTSRLLSSMQQAGLLKSDLSDSGKQYLRQLHKNIITMDEARKMCRGKIYTVTETGIQVLNALQLLKSNNLI